MQKNKIEVQQLPCELVDAEILQMGQALAADMVQSKKVEAEFEKVKKSYKAKLELLYGAIDKAGVEIAERIQIREVNVELVPHFQSNEIEYIRTDTGETVSQRAMYPEERAEQETIPGVKPGDADQGGNEIPLQQ